MFDLINYAEKGFLPDSLIRLGIRRLCKERINSFDKNCEKHQKKQNKWIELLKNSPIAILPEKANEQHYEVPPPFFTQVLGKNLKYSSGFWEKETTTLDESEDLMLDKTIRAAEIDDGMKILELGCGWGSLTFAMAKKYKNSEILAVSNSKDQRAFIEKKCENEKISNIKIKTVDMNNFNPEEKFDRIISVEMFEHMRNYQLLLRKIEKWLNKNGKLFVHIFSHKTNSYPFEDETNKDWMAREFFSGGQMPAHDLLLNFQDDLIIDKTWRYSGKHYSKTSFFWLKNMDKNKSDIIKLFDNIYGNSLSNIWFQRWRIFFMSCEELFGYNNGNEWGVSHYLFKKR